MICDCIVTIGTEAVPLNLTIRFVCVSFRRKTKRQNNTQYFTCAVRTNHSEYLAGRGIPNGAFIPLVFVTDLDLHLKNTLKMSEGPFSCDAGQMLMNRRSG